MAEVLATGPPERQRRRGPRFAVAVVAAALLAGVAVARSGVDGAEPERAARPAPPSGPSHVAAAGPEVELPGRLAGVRRPVPRGVRLLVGGPVPAAIGGTGVALDRLRLRDESVGALLRVRGGVVARIDPHQFTASPNSRVVLVRGDRVVSLGRADEVVAGRTGDRVYLQSYGTDKAHPGTLVERDLAGRELARHVMRSPWFVRGDTAAGLLVEVASPRGTAPETVVLADRRTLRVQRSLGPADYVVAAERRLAAWVLPSWSALRVVDVVTGTARTLSLPRDFNIGVADFTRDGRRLAIAFRGRHPQQPGGTAPGFVEVIDVVTGQRAYVLGVETAIKQAADIAWTPDGRWLALGVGLVHDDARRIGVWPTFGGAVRLLRVLRPGGYQPSALLAL